MNENERFETLKSMTQDMKEKMDKEAFRLYPTFVQDREIYRKGFEAGYGYATEEFEKNRLTACDNMTEKEVEREQRFGIDFLKKNSRTPTFSDCIDITRQQVIDKAVKFLKSTDFCQYYNKEFIDEFRRKMEE